MSVGSNLAFRPTPHFRERRRRGMLLASMVNADGGQRRIMVRDFSAKGLSAAAQGEPPVPDEVVSIHLPDGRVAWGMVRWVRRNLFGVEFGVDYGASAPAETSGADGACGPGTAALPG